MLLFTHTKQTEMSVHTLLLLAQSEQTVVLLLRVLALSLKVMSLFLPLSSCRVSDGSDSTIVSALTLMEGSSTRNIFLSSVFFFLICSHQPGQEQTGRTNWFCDILTDWRCFYSCWVRDAQKVRLKMSSTLTVWLCRVCVWEFILKSPFGDMGVLWDNGHT